MHRVTHARLLDRILDCEDVRDVALANYLHRIGLSGIEF